MPHHFPRALVPAGHRVLLTSLFSSLSPLRSLLRPSLSHLPSSLQCIFPQPFIPVHRIIPHRSGPRSSLGNDPTIKIPVDVIPAIARKCAVSPYVLCPSQVPRSSGDRRLFPVVVGDASRGASTRVPLTDSSLWLPAIRKPIMAELFPSLSGIMFVTQEYKGIQRKNEWQEASWSLELVLFQGRWKIRTQVRA